MNYGLEIRAEIAKHHLQNYQVAERMNISNSLFYQRLQRSMTKEQAEKFFEAIRELAAERKQAQQGA